MDDVYANSASVQRNVILGLLLTVAVAAWAALVWQSADGDTMASPTMGMLAPLFLAIWAIMMVAMMLPTAAPMILTFHKVRAGRDGAFASTWVFVVAYLLVWVLAGVAAYAGALASEAIAACAALYPTTAARIGGAVLVAAGLYQLTPLKDFCLSKCRTPISFITTSWRDGSAGAFHMGLLHGAYCLGCCWLLFVILFPLGIMNVGAMAAVTLIILAEKTLPWPRLTPYAAAFALVLYGALVIASPQLLPTFKQDGGTAMPAEMRMNMPGSVGQPQLPIGSEAPWERYLWEIILLIVAMQAALLSVLLYERRRRTYAEALTATVAHELSQPLVSILANSEAAKALLMSPSPNLAELREILTDIQRDDQRASEVIRRLRSQLKKASLERRDNDLNEIIQDTVEMLSRSARSRDIDLSSETVSGELPIKCDRVQLQEVIINLVVNSIDALAVMPRARRKVTVTTTRVKSFAEVAVADTGEPPPN